MDAGGKLKNPVDMGAFIEALPLLLDTLRTNGLGIGVGEYADAHRLIRQMAARGQLPTDPMRLRPYLGPLLCASPAEQETFSACFSDWAAGMARPADGGEPAPMDADGDEASLQQLGARSRLWVPMFLGLLLLGSAGLYWLGPGVPPDIGISMAWGRAALWGSLIVFGVCGVGLLVREIWLRILVARYLKRRPADAPFEIQPFRVAARMGLILRTLELRRTAQALRKHIRAPDADLDVDATVRRTAGAGGFFIPVFGYRYQTPQYLALVDRAAFRDHQADWADTLLDRLAGDDVFIRRYHFDRDPRSCVPASGTGRPMDLTELAARYWDHRLILVSDGAGLISPFTGRVVDWIGQLHPWEHRALLTLGPVAGHPLADQDFVVMPADEAGLSALIDRFQAVPGPAARPGPPTPPLPDILEGDSPDQRPPDPEAVERMAQSLHAVLDDAGWYWLCACAVYPDLRWGLTLHLGHCLTDDAGIPLFSRQRLFMLARLPWFRYGYMPDWLRRRLIDDDGFQGGPDRRVRRILFELIRTAGTAGTLRLDCAHPVERLIPRIIRRMKRRASDRLAPSDPLRDRIFVTFMANPLSVRIPREVRKLLARGRERETHPDETPVVARRRPRKQMVNDLGMTFVYIPPGTFMMGSPADEPGRWNDEKRHEVTLTAGFYIQTTPVTQGQWERVMGKNPSYFTGCGPNGPVENVSWEDAREFIRKLNELEGTDLYRLPTEAEWEYACRAGTATAIYTGTIEILGERDAPALDPIAWYGGNSGVDYEGGYDSSDWAEKQYDHTRAGTHPVGLKQPNAWGLYDMLGNVNEWCSDYWSEEYPDGPVVNPTGPADGANRVIRGGSWSGLARRCRAAYRSYRPPGDRDGYVGLRLSRSLP